jgi:glutamate-1-semialdehyde 2,1-aminomutase
MEQARRLIPGGVSSSPRTGQRPCPLAVVRGSGSRLTDVDGNEYIDYIGAYGPLLLGHGPSVVVDAVRASLDAGLLFGLQHEGEIRAAEAVVEAVPSVDIVSFFGSGSEAVNASLGVARGVTKRQLVVKFEGHYHGWIEPIGVSQPGAAPQPGPSPLPPIDVPGWPATGSVLVCPWNDTEALAGLFADHGAAIAAVIMEPIACNGGTLQPEPGYLDSVRDLCADHGSLIIFDEVITGFRMSVGGAQERLGFQPDITVLAKAIASGFPVAAVGGSEAVMAGALETGVGLRGTYNGNPPAMAATVATIEHLSARRDDLYPRLDGMGAALAAGLRDLAATCGAALSCNQVGSVVSLFWGLDTAPTTYAEVARSNSGALATFEGALTDAGVLSLPGGRLYVSAAHDDGDIDQTLSAAARALTVTMRAHPA